MLFVYMKSSDNFSLTARSKWNIAFFSFLNLSAFRNKTQEIKSTQQIRRLHKCQNSQQYQNQFQMCKLNTFFKIQLNIKTNFKCANWIHFLKFIATPKPILNVLELNTFSKIHSNIEINFKSANWIHFPKFTPTSKQILKVLTVVSSSN